MSIGRTPVWFHPSISAEDIDNALASVGIHIRSDASHRLVADRVPACFRKDEPVAATVETKPDEKVARMPGRVRVVK